MNIGILPYLLIALVLAISVHECAHALSAYALGDDTAQKEGRLTLNPLAHLDPLGTLMLFLVHFGWGKPVPVNPRNFTRPVFYNVLVAMSGPLSNLLLALISLTLLKHQLTFGNAYVTTFLHVFYDLNVFLMLFNLLPIPPLDGGHLLEAVLAPRAPQLTTQILQYGPVVLLTLLLVEHMLHVRLLSAVLVWGYEMVTLVLFPLI